MRAYQPAALVANLQEMPYRSDVQIGIGEIGMIPIHPLTETLALFGDYAREFFNAVHALCGEFVDAVLNDVALDLDTEILLGLNLYPQALRIETVLILAGLTEHRVILDVHVLHRSAPGMVDTHRVIGGDGTVEEAEAFAVFVLFDEFIETTVIFPELKHRFFYRYKIGFAVFFFHKIAPYRVIRSRL